MVYWKGKGAAHPGDAGAPRDEDRPDSQLHLLDSPPDQTTQPVADADIIPAEPAEPVQLMLFDRARAALAELRSIDEVKSVRDKAVAMAEYARQAKDSSLIDYATEIRARAERRCGEILREMSARGERHKGHGDQKTESQRAIPKLADIGVTASQSSRWQQLAELDEAAFESKVAALKRKAAAVVEPKMREKKAKVRSSASRENALDICIDEVSAVLLKALRRLDRGQQRRLRISLHGLIDDVIDSEIESKVKAPVKAKAVAKPRRKKPKPRRLPSNAPALAGNPAG